MNDRVVIFTVQGLNLEPWSVQRSALPLGYGSYGSNPEMLPF